MTSMHVNSKILEGSQLSMQWLCFRYWTKWGKQDKKRSFLRETEAVCKAIYNIQTNCFWCFKHRLTNAEGRTKEAQDRKVSISGIICLTFLREKHISWEATLTSYIKEFHNRHVLGIYTCAIVWRQRTAWPSPALISFQSTGTLEVLPNLNPLIVPKGPSNQILKTSLYTFTAWRCVRCSSQRKTCIVTALSTKHFQRPKIQYVSNNWMLDKNAGRISFLVQRTLMIKRMKTVQEAFSNSYEAKHERLASMWESSDRSFACSQIFREKFPTITLEWEELMEVVVKSRYPLFAEEKLAERFGFVGLDWGDLLHANILPLVLPILGLVCVNLPIPLVLPPILFLLAWPSTLCPWSQLLYPHILVWIPVKIKAVRIRQHCVL